VEERCDEEFHFERLVLVVVVSQVVEFWRPVISKEYFEAVLAEEEELCGVEMAASLQCGCWNRGLGWIAVPMHRVLI
jgi:hypothetical protein